MPAPFMVPLTCPVCRRPMTVSIQLPRVLEPRQETVQRVIPCPYEGCKGSITAGLHGDILAVWSGHEPV